jgi:hypothetical protein
MKKISSIPLVLLLISCGATIKTNITNNSNIEKLKNTEVLLLDNPNDLPTNSILIGDIAIGDSGITTNCSRPEVIQTAKSNAILNNSNILLIEEIKEPNVWSTCYRLKGKLYYNNSENLSKLIEVKNMKFKSNDYYITNSNDTIQCEITFSNSKKLKVMVNNEKKTFRPHEIKSFTYDEDKNYKFVSLKNDSHNFYREIIFGKLSYYEVYGNNYYDGTPVSYPVMVKDDKIVWLNVINPRERVAKLISDCPELLKEWEEGSKYSLENKDAIVNAYNECVSKDK